MTPSRPLDPRVIVAISTSLVLGCVATWIVMDIRMRKEREEMRKEMQQVQESVKESIKGAASEVLSAEYAEQKILEETGKILGGPSGKDASPPPKNLADAGVKLGAKTAKDALHAVQENEKEVGEVKDAAVGVVRTGLRALLEAAKGLSEDASREMEREPEPGDEEELPEPKKGPK